jgi:3-phenylpropionate/cinnamic acid dioxygenase small subunit
VPAGDNPSANDTGRHVSLVYDDRQRLTERVLRFSTGFAHSQEPRSQLARLVSNVRVLSEQDGLTRVRSKLLISETRFGEARHHGATVEHVLRSTTGGAEVVKKSVFLTESNNFLPNLTYIL